MQIRNPLDRIVLVDVDAVEPQPSSMANLSPTIY
jgi:hypothetical protein